MERDDQGLVLVVNDDFLQLKLAANILAADGYQVITCQDVETALSQLEKSEPPDVIITDLHMPGIDGWKFCRLLRSPAYPGFNHTPILVISATLAGEHARNITQDLGANAFLSLPCEPAILRRYVACLRQGLSPLETTTVLIVEDSVVLGKLIRRSFEVSGYRAMLATSAQEARQLWLEHQPRVAVIDYHLPDMMGDELLAEFKQPGGLGVAIMMTADASPELATQFLRQGADGYVRKPFDPQYLVALCEKAQHERALLRVEEILKTRNRELKEAFVKLQESEKRYRSIFENEVIGIFHSTVEGQFSRVNKAMARMLGYRSPQEIMAAGRDVGREMYARPGQLAAMIRKVSRRTEGVKCEAELRRRSGEIFVAHLWIRAVMGNDGATQYLEGFVEDITERKRADEALKLSEEKMRLVIEASPIGVIINQQGKYLYVNPALIEMFGYEDPEEIIGQPSGSKFFAGQSQVMAQQRQKCSGRELLPGSHEIKAMKKNGEIFEVNVWRTEIDYRGYPAMLEFVIDVSEAKNLRAQLMQSQKLEAVGTLAGGVAHDFNNILGVIIGYTEMAQTQVSQESPLGYNLAQIMTAGQRAADLVNQILTFSRPSKQELRAMRLGPVLKESLRFMRSSLPTTIDIRTKLAAAEDLLLADATQIHQVLINLCTNAAHAMRERGGELEIGLREANRQEMAGSGLGLASDAEYLELSVRDTGHGMDAKTMERIFDPFFTTKEPGEGTGMGLAVVHGIIQGHGGAITVSSRLGEGSLFRVYLPKQNGNLVARGEEKARPEEAIHGHERILLVDDEQNLVEIGEKMLSRLGYEVVALTSSVEAWEMFQAAPGGFDLVITDQTMPLMTGVELARRMLARRPGMPIILCTGYSETVIRETAMATGISEFLMKPVRMANLAQVIRKVLSPEEVAAAETN